MNKTKLFNNDIKTQQILKVLISGAIFWYILLCFLHLLSNRPLWNDEFCVFESIRQFSNHDLFNQRLLHDQVFPHAYLFLIKYIALPFDFSRIALRFASFICMMTGFLLWLKIASYEFDNKWDYLNWVLAWCGSVMLIYYAAELKPYSMDVLVGSVFVLFLYHQEKLESGNQLKYALTLSSLPIFVLFSYPAYTFVFLPIYNLLLSIRKDKTKIKFLILYCISLLIFGLLSYYFDIRLRPVSTVSKGFGDYFIASTSIGDFFKTFGEGTMNLFSRWFIERPRILKKIGLFFVGWGLIYLFFGFITHFKKDNFRLKSLHTIAFAVFVQLVILGILRKYPFTVPRTSLFYCPIVIFLTLKGFGLLGYIHRYLKYLIRSGFMYYLITISIGLSFFVFNNSLSFAPKLW